MAIRLRQAVVVLFLCALAIPGLEGQAPAPQSSTGVVIEGTIVDNAQAALPGVRVTLEHVNTVVAEAVSDTAGKFRFENLQPGAYTVRTARGTIKPALAPAPPQGSNASSLSGVVKDKDGGVIPGATVVAKNNATGAPLTTTTNSAGVFSFPTLDPGSYIVRISLQSFKTVEYTDVRLLAATPGTLPPTVLEIGAMTERVEVRGQTDLIRTQGPPANMTVTGEFIESLPRSDRNALSFTVFLPGTQASGAQNSRASTVAGLPQGSINVTMDGISAGNNLQSGDSFFTQARPRVDAVQEVTISPADRSRAPGTESYAPIASNPFRLTTDEPLSTFGADVDTASYTNVRRFLTNGQLPPIDAVRVEELVNYFHFSYPGPTGRRPVSITTEVGECPWAPGHQLALVGVRARAIDDRDVRARNIVLLVDVSGSMATPDKLPLVKTALRMFVDTLRDQDRIAIVVYAGASGLALPSTSGEDRQRIHAAIESLQASGSTNGGEGLVLAYRVAGENFVRGGINRVLLATDGDFNVGVTGEGDLLQLIERQKQSGVFLSVLGVGTGNLKDRTMEMLADRGNGHYAYLDSLQEAQRVLVREGGATLETVAKDVKFQVEFNPAQIAAWRLIGYEDRLMAHQDFNDDRKDGGELGAGHTVTVLYEIVPAGALRSMNVPGAADRPVVDPLRYQTSAPAPARLAPAPQMPATRAYADELLAVKVRYKQPDADVSELIAQPLRRGGTAPHVPFAAAVAEFGLLLRDTQAPAVLWDQLVSRTKTLAAAGTETADRQSFSELVELAAGLKRIR